MFNLTSEQINDSNAVHTTREIHQQPAVWQELVTGLLRAARSIQRIP